MGRPCHGCGGRATIALPPMWRLRNDPRDSLGILV
jgi:hypothetical protein